MAARPWRRRLALVLAVPALAAAVLGAEVVLATTGDRLDEGRFELSGRVGDGQGEALRVVWLGDSTAAGVGAGSVEASLPRVVAAGLGRLGWPVELTVLAVSGDRVGDVVDDQLPRLTDADVVFVSVGANDVTHLTRRDDFRARYRRLLDGLPEDAEVVLLGVPDMGAVPRLAQPLRAVAGWRGRSLAEDVESLAAEAGATFVDLAGETGPAFRSDPDRFFAADDYHPSAAGYRLWADAVLRAAKIDP